VDEEDLAAEVARLDRRITALQARAAELARQVEQATTAEAIIRMSRHLKAVD
jgi:prefoldin subunit 5